MNLTKQEARDIIANDHPDWDTVVRPTLTGQDRWAVQYTGVFKYIPTNDCYRLNWSEGATELQSELPFEYTDPKPVLVEPVFVTVCEWHPTT